MSEDTTFKVFDKGDFQIRLAYVNPQPLIVGSTTEPAMLVVGKRKTSKSAWVIMLEAAWKYVDDHDSHSNYMHMASAKIAEDFLHLGSDIKTRFKIAETILEHIPDLLAMPPYAKPLEVQGSVVGKIGDQVIETEVMG